MARVGGIITLRLNGEVQKAKGVFSYNIGAPMREEVIGSNGDVDFSEKPQAPMVEGEITDRGDMDLRALLLFENGTVTLELANGKTIVIGGAFFAGSGEVQTEEGNIKVKFIGSTGEEA